MEIPFRELAITQADKLVVCKLQTALSFPDPSIGKINDAIIPDIGIRRKSTVIRRICTNRCNRIRWSIRNSNLRLNWPITT